MGPHHDLEGPTPQLGAMIEADFFKRFTSIIYPPTMICLRSHTQMLGCGRGLSKKLILYVFRQKSPNRHTEAMSGTQATWRCLAEISPLRFFLERGGDQGCNPPADRAYETGSCHLLIVKVVACSSVGMRHQHHIAQRGGWTGEEQFGTPLPSEDGHVSTTSPSGEGRRPGGFSTLLPSGDRDGTVLESRSLAIQHPHTQ